VGLGLSFKIPYSTQIMTPFMAARTAVVEVHLSALALVLYGGDG
jgi:hypothetical protein